jgi:methanogenic corrinoid protein MtbC1
MVRGARLRIGELSKRVGVSPELLRAWESRYELMSPERTPGGLRLFSEEDEVRVRRMCAHVAAGVPASEAARLAKFEDAGVGGPDAGRGFADVESLLDEATDSLDELEMQSALDALFQRLSLPRALQEVILPFFNRVGERWAASELSVAQEHFASNVIGARLRGLSRGWGGGVGPRVVLACPPGERHDLGLLCFGLILRERGWRITYFGADTPLEDIAIGLGTVLPTMVVLCATTPEPLEAARREIALLAQRVRVGVGGAGASEELVVGLGAELLAEDPVYAAEQLRPRMLA